MTAMELLADDWQEFEDLQSYLNKTGAWDISPGSGLSHLEEVHLMSNVIVTQSAETGHWIATAGDKVVEFGKTQADFDKAQWLAVNINNPEIADLANKLVAKFEVPGIEARARRAAALAANGKVAIVKQPPDDSEPGLISFASVRTFNAKPTSYWIQLDEEGNYRCSCPDFRGQYVPTVELSTGPQKFCKHLLAYFMVKHFERPVQQVNVGKRNGNSIRVPKSPAKETDPPIYANGDSVESDDLEVFRSYVNALKSKPPDRDKMYGWLYRG